VIGQPLEASEPPSREEDGAAQMGARAPLGVTESLTLRPKSACANTRAGAHRVSRRTWPAPRPQPDRSALSESGDRALDVAELGCSAQPTQL